MNPIAKIRTNGGAYGKSNASEVNEGVVAVDAEVDGIFTPVMVWLTPTGQEVARIAVYFDTGTNIGSASYQGLGTDAGDIGVGEIQGLNRTESKYGYIQVTSDGSVVINLTNGKLTNNGDQRVEIQSRTNDFNHVNSVLTLNSSPDTGAANGFGVRLDFYDDTNFMGSIQGFYDGTDRYLQFAHAVTPQVTGVRTGTLAQLQTVMQNLLAKLDTLGLVDDVTT